MGPCSDGPATALDVRELRMRYGTKDVLTGVTFSAQRGEVLALLGPNGAGKTTTIEILEGFRVRSAGEVSVLGTDPARGNAQEHDLVQRTSPECGGRKPRDHARLIVRGPNGGVPLQPDRSGQARVHRSASC